VRSKVATRAVRQRHCSSGSSSNRPLPCKPTPSASAARPPRPTIPARDRQAGRQAGRHVRLPELLLGFRVIWRCAAALEVLSVREISVDDDHDEVMTVAQHTQPHHRQQTHTAKASRAVGLSTMVTGDAVLQ
jgi:hypothetical protein